MQVFSLLLTSCRAFVANDASIFGLSSGCKIFCVLEKRRIGLHRVFRRDDVEAVDGDAAIERELDGILVDADLLAPNFAASFGWQRI